MPKSLKVSIINKNQLRLDEDAKKDDIVDLEQLTEIDLSSVENIYNSELQRLSEVRVKEALVTANEKAQYELEIKLAEVKNEQRELLYKQKTADKEIINELTNKIANYEKDAEIVLTGKLNEQKEVLGAEIIRLNHLISDCEKTSELRYVNGTNVLQNKVNELQSKIDQSDELVDLTIANHKKDLELKYAELINEKDNEISQLKRDRSALNVKKIGENLENWCNNEYETYAQVGFKNCLFYKDNKAIKTEDDVKATKADFVFEIYKDNTKFENELLAKVIIEMKSEDPNSANKKTNASHYKKLDIDRNKKNATYAILVSELEITAENDIPIRVVSEYENMYLVRPQYLIALLTTLNNINLKYKDAYDTLEEKLELNEKQKVLEDFNKLKEELIKRNVEEIGKKISVISELANKIVKNAEEILKQTEDVMQKTLVKAEKTINDFKIEKIIKKID